MKIQNIIIMITVALMVLSMIAFGMANRKQPVPEVQETTFAQLIASPSKYNEKQVTFDAFVFLGFEVMALSESLEPSGYSPGHLIPRGKLIWIEGEIPKQVYQQLYPRQIMGPLERYGKVKLTGRFQSGAKYGHLGGYDYQVKPSKMELLSWSIEKKGT